MHTATKSATLVKKLEQYHGDARLYRLAPSLEYSTMTDDEGLPVLQLTEYLVVSSLEDITVETLIFAAEADGDITDWTDLDGSVRGETTHARVLSSLGYNLEEEN